MYAALDGRHVAAAEILLGEASVLRVAGRSGLAGDYQGRQAILALLARMSDLTGGTLDYGDPGSASSDQGVVVLEGSVHASRGGQHLDAVVEVQVAVKAGELQEVGIRYLDQMAFDAFWS